MNKLTIGEAAERLGISKQALRTCIDHGKYDFAVKIQNISGRATYVLSRPKFENYLGGNKNGC